MTQTPRVTAEETARHLQRLAQQRGRLAVARAERLRSRLPEAASLLRSDYGAESVVLFGSLAAGRPREDSDVDLAVTGLPRARYFDALSTLMNLFGAPVELVCLEEAPQSLRARVAAEGEGPVSASLQRLRAEIRFDRDAFARLVDELGSIELATDADEAPQRAQAAVALHHAYGSLESIMVRVARQLEGEVPGGTDWNQALLHSMGLEIEGVRPAVFSRATIGALRRLLGFRHFFRHAYAVELDAERLAIVRDEAVAGASAILAELDALDRFLASVADMD